MISSTTTHKQQRLKVLFVSHVYPWPLLSGTYQRVFYLASAMAQQHDVTFFTMSNRPEGEQVDDMPLRSTCQEVIEFQTDRLVDYKKSLYKRSGTIMERIWTAVSSLQPSEIRRWKSETLINELKQLRAENDFDVVWVERHFLAESVRKAGFKNIILDADGLHCQSLSRQLSQRQWYKSKPFDYLDFLKLRHYERRLTRKYPHTVVCNPDDVSFFCKVDGEELAASVVPNGTVLYPTPDVNQEKPGQILFVGSMNYGANVDAVHYFVREIFPEILKACPEVSFHIVGAGHAESIQELNDGKTIIYHGQVENLDDYFADASLFVVPLRVGNGTKLKVLEAMARGKAVITTSVGAEGICLESGVHFVVTDDNSDFAMECQKLISDMAKRQKIASAGREAVQKQFAWEAIGDQVNELIQNVVNDASKPKASI